MDYAFRPLFVIFEIIGIYYFAPSFSPFDYYLMEIDPGEQCLHVLPEFIWPENTGAVDGVIVYSSMTDPQITELFGQMDSFTFGWHE